MHIQGSHKVKEEKGSGNYTWTQKESWNEQSTAEFQISAEQTRQQQDDHIRSSGAWAAGEGERPEGIGLVWHEESGCAGRAEGTELPGLRARGVDERSESSERSGEPAIIDGPGQCLQLRLQLHLRCELLVLVLLQRLGYGQFALQPHLLDVQLRVHLCLRLGLRLRLSLHLGLGLGLRLCRDVDLVVEQRGVVEETQTLGGRNHRGIHHVRPSSANGRGRRWGLRASLGHAGIGFEPCVVQRRLGRGVGSGGVLAALQSEWGGVDGGVGRRRAGDVTTPWQSDFGSILVLVR